MGFYCVVDAFWGDNGKGLVSAWMSLIKRGVATFRGCGGANPEHGIFIKKYYLKVNQLPLGFVFVKGQAGLGPGTAVDPRKFLFEVNRFGLTSEDVKIDPNCTIITKKNIEEEKKNANMKLIGSTFSGTGIAMSHAALRIAPIAGSDEYPEARSIKPYLGDIPQWANDLALEHIIGLESTQGTFLSRYYGEHPNVTSVDITTGSLIAGVGVNPHLLESVILCVKTMPTREGAGYMGGVEELAEEEMIENGIVEYSSIKDSKTKEYKIRRKSKRIDFDLLKRAVMLNGATEIALTFAEHWDPEVKNVTKWADITPKVRKLIDKVEKETGIPVTLINTGKQFTSMVSKHDDLPKITDEMMQRIESYI